MSMTRKDFNLLASTLRAERVSPDLARALARALAAEYPRFSTEGFIAACNPAPDCHGCADPANHPHAFDCERSPQRATPEPPAAGVGVAVAAMADRATLSGRPPLAPADGDTLNTPYALAWQTLADDAVLASARITATRAARLIQAAIEAERARVAEQITEAIEADRDQRDIYELIAEALEDRAGADDERGGRARTAARSIRGEAGEWYDAVWDTHIGPMLDRMEEDYGA